MSHEVDELYDVYHEEQRRARKLHRCIACPEPIPVGVKYTRVFVLFDGVKGNFKRCARCQAIHLHLRERCRKERPDYWPAEDLNCGETYEDEWGPCPPEIAALAFALPGEVSNGR